MGVQIIFSWIKDFLSELCHVVKSPIVNLKVYAFIYTKYFSLFNFGSPTDLLYFSIMVDFKVKGFLLCIVGSCRLIPNVMSVPKDS